MRHSVGARQPRHFAMRGNSNRPRPRHAVASAERRFARLLRNGMMPERTAHDWLVGAHVGWEDAVCAYIAELQAARDRTRAALRDLVAQLQRVHADERFVNVWIWAQLHQGPYRGPTYTAELETAQRVIAEGP